MSKSRIETTAVAAVVTAFASHQRSRMRLSVAARVCAIGAIALGLVACASNKEPSYVHGPQSARLAMADPRPAEVEDDGMPVQAAPVRKLRPDEDDPTQPWSPNYGRGGAIVPMPPPIPRGTYPHRAPAEIEARLRPAIVISDGHVRRLSEDEADAIVLRAMAQHELRRP